MSKAMDHVQGVFWSVFLHIIGSVWKDSESPVFLLVGLALNSLHRYMKRWEKKHFFKLFCSACKAQKFKVLDVF